jgi:hypothetical protein
MATNIIMTRASVQAAESQATEILDHAASRWWVAVVFGVAFAALTFKPIFKDWSGFWYCIRYWLKPDWISFWQGETAEDWWAETKLGFWIALSAVFGVLAYFKLPLWLPAWFG